MIEESYLDYRLKSLQVVVQLEKGKFVIYKKFLNLKIEGDSCGEVIDKFKEYIKIKLINYDIGNMDNLFDIYNLESNKKEE